MLGNISNFNTTTLKKSSQYYIDNSVDLSLYDFQIFYLLFIISACDDSNYNEIANEDEECLIKLRKTLGDASEALDISEPFRLLSKMFLPFKLSKIQCIGDKLKSLYCNRAETMITGGCHCRSCSFDNCHTLTKSLTCKHNKIRTSTPPSVGCLEFNKRSITRPPQNDDDLIQLRTIYNSMRSRCARQNGFKNIIKVLCGMDYDCCKKLRLFFVTYPFMRGIYKGEEAAKYINSYFLILYRWRIIRKRELRSLMLTWRDRFLRVLKHPNFENSVELFFNDLIVAFA